MSVEFLYKALESELGIVVTSNDPELLRQRLYKARAEAHNPDFDSLVFKPSVTNPTTELWIIKTQKVSK